MKNAIALASFSVAFAALAASPAKAETPPVPGDQQVVSIADASQPAQTDAAAAASADSNASSVAATTEADPFAKAVPLSDDVLSEHRGGESIVIGNQTLKAVTSGNVLNGTFNGGSINLSDNALSNFSGLGNFAINTGAQVSLQSGMNVVINISQ